MIEVIVTHNRPVDLNEIASTEREIAVLEKQIRNLQIRLDQAQMYLKTLQPTEQSTDPNKRKLYTPPADPRFELEQLGENELHVVGILRRFEPDGLRTRGIFEEYIKDFPSATELEVQQYSKTLLKADIAYKTKPGLTRLREPYRAEGIY